MKPDNNWFTEIAEEAGSAFSLRCKRKLLEKKSDYQTIEVYETTDFGNLMVIDGFIMLSQRDNFIYHEMLVHPALYSHPDPRHVAIIGGGDCGSLREVLKHDVVEKVTQIDIDEQVTRVAEKYFPELCESNDDPRAELQFIDGIQWMREQPENSLDVIIVDSTDPVGPGEVLFTEDFYRSCADALRGDGLVVQQSESPLLHNESIIQPMKQRMQAAGLANIATLFFPLPVYPSGWWSATVGSKKPFGFSREQAWYDKPIETRYYNPEIHRAAFAAPQFMR